MFRYGAGHPIYNLRIPIDKLTLTGNLSQIYTGDSQGLFYVLDNSLVYSACDHVATCITNMKYAFVPVQDC